MLSLLGYLDQFLLGPDLDWLHLLRRLGLNAVGVQKDLKSTNEEKMTSPHEGYVHPAATLWTHSIEQMEGQHSGMI